MNRSPAGGSGTSIPSPCSACGPASSGSSHCSTRSGARRSGYRVVHVVGTNGKSSTTRYDGVAARRSGAARRGVPVAAHQRVHGARARRRPAGSRGRSSARAVDRVRDEVATPARRISARRPSSRCSRSAALLAFAESGVEAVALEAGLGGRLDATNVVEAPVVVLTNIGLEHTEVLGDTREAIFAEKAAVIKGGDAVFGPLDGLEEAAEEVCARARCPRAPPRPRRSSSTARRPASPCARRTPRTPTCALSSPAAYQVVNAGLAVAAAELLLGSARRRHGPRSAAARRRSGPAPGARTAIRSCSRTAPTTRTACAPSSATLGRPRPAAAPRRRPRHHARQGLPGHAAPTLCRCSMRSSARELQSREVFPSSSWRRRRDAAAVASHRVPSSSPSPIPMRPCATPREQAGTRGSVLSPGSLYLLEDLADLLA